jgi:hypothetical protein
LHSLNIESFDREGDQVTIGMEGNSHVMLDWSKRGSALCLAVWKWRAMTPRSAR